MIKNLSKKLSAILIATLMLIASGCTENDDSSGSKPSDSSDGALTTTAPAETSAPDTSTTTASQTSSNDDDDPEKPPADGEPSGITPAMWKIETEKGNTIYMLGSMHVLPDEAYPLPDIIMDIYENADAVAFECDTNAFLEDTEALSEYYSMMLLSDGTVKDHLDEDVYNGIVEKLTDWGVYNVTYDYFHPAVWSSLLEETISQKAQMYADNGIDYYFLDLCKEDGKEIIEIENAMDQMKLLFGFSDEFYNLQLSSYLKYSDNEIVEQYTELYKAWAEGDVDSLAEEDAEGMTEEEIALVEDYNKKLLDDRNIGMADKIEELCQGDKDILYMVGAAHFPGENGILSLLEQKGIEYERVSYE